MDCNQFKTVVALVDALVRSAYARRSRVLLPYSPVGVTVSNKSLTNFSICSILGLENDVTQSSPSSECHSDSSPPLSPYSECTSPRPSHRESSPMLTPYSDIASSSSDCGSESDQAPTQSEQPQKMKRQRTTFSRNKVFTLEQAFRRRPYLIGDDDEKLGQRLGIPAKSVKYWFQNRRAKSRKLERKTTTVCQTVPLNQFELPKNRVTHPRRLQSVNRSPKSDHWKQAECISYPLTEVNGEDGQYSRPIGPDRNHSIFQPNQFRGDHPLVLPMFHPDQFKIRPAELAKLPCSRVASRFQPY